MDDEPETSLDELKAAGDAALAEAMRVAEGARAMMLAQSLPVAVALAAAADEHEMAFARRDILLTTEDGGRWQLQVHYAAARGIVTVNGSPVSELVEVQTLEALARTLGMKEGVFSFAAPIAWVRSANDFEIVRTMGGSTPASDRALAARLREAAAEVLRTGGHRDAGLVTLLETAAARFDPER